MPVGDNRDGVKTVTPASEVADRPWAPAVFTLPQAHAMQSLARGDASEEEQVTALSWIVENLCDVYGMSFRPDSARDTDFAEGKRFVGNQIIKLTKLNLAIYKENDDE